MPLFCVGRKCIPALFIALCFEYGLRKWRQGPLILDLSGIYMLLVNRVQDRVVLG